MTSVSKMAGGGGSTSGFDSRRVLDWIYAGRLIVTLGIYGAAVVAGSLWFSESAALLGGGVRTAAIVALAVVGIVTPISYWHSRRSVKPLGPAFLYGQALLDIVLVTGVVHLTGGTESVFPPLLYIVLVSGYALLLPLPAAVVVALACGIAYLLDVAVFYPELLDGGLAGQIAIFTLVAIVTGAIGGKLRQIGQELSSVEDELARLQLGTSDILRTISSGVITLDAGGRAAYLNPAAEELLKLPPSEWVGGNVREVLSERAPGVAEAVARTFGTGRVVRNEHVEIQQTGSSGRPRPVSVQTGLLERPGESSLVTVVLQDMRLARQIEELHLRAGRFEAVAELSASLAHEIKNPLASIRSAVEQISAPGSEDEDRDMLTRLIIRETDRLSNLLGDFNDFARVDVLDRSKIDLDKVVAEAVELVRQRPEAKDRATFELDLGPPLDDIWGDPDLVHRTLVNLLLNAIQVGDPERPVKVRIVADSLSPDMVPREVTPGAPVRIRVIDDGPGIAPDDIGRIFDPFYTRRKGGSGMGLAIAHRAIQAHGGALLVSSVPGGGATFAIVLPRRDQRERQELERLGWPDRPDRPGMRISDHVPTSDPGVVDTAVNARAGSDGLPREEAEGGG